LATPIKIMTYNIDCRVCDLKKENGDSFRQRVSFEKDVIARYDADLIGIQEQVIARDVKMLTPDGFGSLYMNDTKWLPWHNYPDAVIMYRESRFAVKQWDTFWLGPNPNAPVGYDRFALPRLAVWAILEDKVDNKEVFFGSTHFDHGDDMEGSNTDCTSSAKQVLSFAEPYAKTYPIVWVGDYNSNPNSNAFHILTNSSTPTHFKDTWSADIQTVAYNQATQPSYDYNDAIDHILYIDNPSVATYEVLDWTVDMYTYGDRNLYPSDHWAVISTVDIKQN